MAELKIIGMDEVAVEEIEWLWYPYIESSLSYTATRAKVKPH